MAFGGAMPVGGAVLTGGASRRMGRDKATLPVAGRPMASTVAAALREAGCVPVLAVGGDHRSLAPLGLPWTADAVAGIGPAGGLLAALDWFAERRVDTGWVTVVACDLPDLTGSALAPLLARVADADAADDEVDVVVAHTSRPQPAVAAWRVGARRRIAADVARGVRALHQLIEASPAAAVALDAAALRNVNTPTDLHEYPGSS
jgi:molybdopterin-guanine dinucleotide biosynthesis protein A